MLLNFHGIVLNQVRRNLGKAVVPTWLEVEILEIRQKIPL